MFPSHNGFLSSTHFYADYPHWQILENFSKNELKVIQTVSFENFPVFSVGSWVRGISGNSIQLNLNLSLFGKIFLKNFVILCFFYFFFLFFRIDNLLNLKPVLSSWKFWFFVFSKNFWKIFSNVIWILIWAIRIDLSIGEFNIEMIVLGCQRFAFRSWNLGVVVW